MKFLPLILAMLFFQFGNKTEMSQNAFVVKRLHVPDKRFTDLLFSIRSEKKERYEGDESVYVFRIKKNVNYYELKLSILYKNNFSWYLINKKDMLLGCFEYKHRNVLVFGDQTKYFKTSKGARTFDFINLKSEDKHLDTGIIPEPPIIFEPNVRVYRIRREKIIFVKDGMLSFLE